LGEGAGVVAARSLLQLAESHRSSEMEEYLDRPSGAQDARRGCHKAFLSMMDRLRCAEYHSAVWPFQSPARPNIWHVATAFSQRWRCYILYSR